MIPDIQALVTGPAVALVLVIIGLAILFRAVISGDLRSGRLVERELDKLTKERDEWKTLALDSTPEIKRLNDLLDTAIKLLSLRAPQ